MCWRGRTVTVPDAALAKPLVTEADVTAFAIAGYLDGPGRRWSLDELTPRTAWNLNFDPRLWKFRHRRLQHLAPRQAGTPEAVWRCGRPGFGFNSGAGSQDVCIDDTWRIDSVIARRRRFRSTRPTVAPPCLAASGDRHGPAIPSPAPILRPRHAPDIRPIAALTPAAAPAADFVFCWKGRTAIRMEGADDGA